MDMEKALEQLDEAIERIERMLNADTVHGTG